MLPDASPPPPPPPPRPPTRAPGQVGLEWPLYTQHSCQTRTILFPLRHHPVPVYRRGNEADCLAEGQRELWLRRQAWQDVPFTPKLPWINSSPLPL